MQKLLSEFLVGLFEVAAKEQGVMPSAYSRRKPKIRALPGQGKVILNKEFSSVRKRMRHMRRFGDLHFGGVNPDDEKAIPSGDR